MSEIAKNNIDTKDSNIGYTYRLQELRKRENLTQEELAEKIDVSAPLVTSMETQKKKLSLRNAMLIAKQFNVSLDWLYGLSDDTKDSASNILATLKDIFDINLEQKYIRIDENLAKFLEGLSKAYKTKSSKEYNLPEEAFNYWVEGLKKTYNENPKGKEKIVYYLQSTDEYLGEIEEERIKKQTNY